MEILIAEITGLAASVFIFAISVPQLVKIIKSKSVQGVSLTTWGLILITYAIWFGYAPRLEALAVVVNNFLAGIVTAILFGYMLYVQSRNKTKAIAISVILFITGSLIGYYIPELIVQILLIASAFIRAPQMFESYQSWKNQKVTQVSLTTWILSTAGSIFWTFYGIMMKDPILIIVPVIALLLAAFITLFELLNARNNSKNI